MAQQGPDVDIFGPNTGVVSQLVDRVRNLKTFAQEFRNNLQVLRLDRQNCIFTRPLADLDTEQRLNIISSTLQNWLGPRSQDYVELQNLNLIIHTCTELSCL